LNSAANVCACSVSAVALAEVVLHDEPIAAGVFCEARQDGRAELAEAGEMGVVGGGEFPLELDLGVDRLEVGGRENAVVEQRLLVDLVDDALEQVPQALLVRLVHANGCRREAEQGCAALLELTQHPKITGRGGVMGLVNDHDQPGGRLLRHQIEEAEVPLSHGRLDRGEDDVVLLRHRRPFAVLGRHRDQLELLLRGGEVGGLGEGAAGLAKEASPVGEPEHAAALADVVLQQPARGDGRLSAPGGHDQDARELPVIVVVLLERVPGGELVVIRLEWRAFGRSDLHRQVGLPIDEVLFAHASSRVTRGRLDCRCGGPDLPRTGVFSGKKSWGGTVGSSPAPRAPALARGDSPGPPVSSGG
jgi:hypothetical protein